MKLRPEIDALLTEIDAFIERSGTTPTSFGKNSVGDPNLYRRLKNNSNLTLATVDRIRSFMRENEKATAA